jgi:hypothetical protein
MSSATVAELTLFAHPAEYGKERGELRMTTTKVAWAADSGPARESIPWAQVTKNEYSIFNPAKAVDVVSVCLTTDTARTVVFTLLGPSEISRHELERMKDVVRDSISMRRVPAPASAPGPAPASAPGPAPAPAPSAQPEEEIILAAEIEAVIARIVNDPETAKKHKSGGGISLKVLQAIAVSMNMPKSIPKDKLVDSIVLKKRHMQQLGEIRRQHEENDGTAFKKNKNTLPRILNFAMQHPDALKESQSLATRTQLQNREAPIARRPVFQQVTAEFNDWNINSGGMIKRR